MPIDCLHMTVLEVAHSRTEEAISKVVEVMESSVASITDHTFSHRAHLVEPMVSYDTSAIALSFLPAADEKESGPAYTYHHLRRDIYNKIRATGVDVASRYVVPSSHLTIARFVNQKDFKGHEDQAVDQTKVKILVDKLDEINSGLQANHWSKHLGEWTIGEEKGLVCRRGTVWYGGGESQHEGRGF